MTKIIYPMPSFRVSTKALLFMFVWACLSGADIPAQSPDEIKLIKQDPGAKGYLCEYSRKKILFLAGSPEEMGKAHGALLKQQIQNLVYKRLYLIAGGYSLHKADWFFTRMEEVRKRTKPHTPDRFLRECKAMSKAAEVSLRDGMNANFFPEMFHCSGFAVRNEASKDGILLHARVLDYMRDINLQELATITVFIPEGYNNWMTLGYAGFIGTVTAMNEKGLAIGEMGGRGEGDWDGMPMNLLLRDIMERAANVEEALNILRSTPRTCEYYYVISDKNRNMVGVYCTADKIEILQPGQQHALLPFVPEDTVLISAGDRAKTLSSRLQDAYGQIDVPKMIEIIKRPVAMNSNLHNAIFMPETLDMWCADAGKKTLACDEPYVQLNLTELIDFYQCKSVLK